MLALLFLFLFYFIYSRPSKSRFLPSFFFFFFVSLSLCLSFQPQSHTTGGFSSADLVPETLRGDDGDLVADSLVGLEVEGEAGVVPLDDDLGGLLDGLGTYATHVGGVLVIVLGDGWKCSFFC